MKRILAFLLALVMLLSLMTGFVGATDEQDLWDRIISYETAHLRKTRSSAGGVTAADFAALSSQIAEMVVASDDYTPGTCTYDGTNAAFFWEDADGEPQFYSPTLRAGLENSSIENDPATVGETVTTSYAARGNNPDGKDVYVIGPWYGSDSSFTDQYKAEGKSIAKASGGTYTLYSGTAATVDNVANAMSNGAVVIFDSHGVTDYDNQLNYTYLDDQSEDVYDSVTEANTSYLTLTSGSGITSADKQAVTGTFGTYYHACSFKSSDGTVYCVDGTVIANHMKKDAPSSLLWMAICLGMATDGISTPLHAKGVEVVYGYSQSVTFDGDYDYEASFWTSVKNGKTVAEAVAAMKKSYGNWDPAYYSAGNYYKTIENARKYFIAFPVVVSSEDSHPGQRTVVSGGTDAQYGADSLQTVKSAWTLKSTCAHSYTYTLKTAPTLTSAGELSGACSKCTATTSVTLPVLDTTNYTYKVTTEPTCTADGAATYTWNETAYGSFGFPITVAALRHSYITSTVDPTCTEQGYTKHLCSRCGDIYHDNFVAVGGHTEAIDAAVPATCTSEGKTEGKHCSVCNTVLVAQQTTAKLSHSYNDGKCTVCGATDPDYTAVDSAAVFKDVGQNAWYKNAVDYTVNHKLFNGTSANTFEPESPMTRAMLVTVLWRSAGEPITDGTNTFVDVPDNKYFTKAVTWADKEGVVKGTAPGIFSPEENVTREQLATILFRYANILKKDTSARGNLSAFVDSGSAHNYAVEALEWAVGAGIISGDKRGSTVYLDPQGNATRAQVATIFMRYLENVVE